MDPKFHDSDDLKWCFHIYMRIYICVYIYVEDDSVHVRSSVYHLILTHMAVVVAGGAPVLARRSIGVSPLLPVGKWMYYHIYKYIHIYIYNYVNKYNI